MIKKCEGTCPFCGSIQILFEDMYRDDNGVAVVYECDDCGESFKEIYTIEYLETTEV